MREIAESMFAWSVEEAGTEEEALYFWAEGQGPDNFTLPRKIRQGRKVEEISMLELRELARKISRRESDPAAALAARLGIKRLHESTRTRLEQAWVNRMTDRANQA